MMPMQFLQHIAIMVHLVIAGVMLVSLALLLGVKAAAPRRFIRALVTGLVTLLALEGAGFAYLRVTHQPSAAEPVDAAGVLWLADFEHEDEARVRWHARNAAITSSTLFATHGAGGAHVTFKDAETPKITMSEALRFDRRRRDWSRYAALVLDLKNVQPSQERLMVQLKDRRGRIYKEEVWLPGVTAQSARLPLDRVAAYLDLRRIAELTVFRWQPGRATTLYLDAVRLEPRHGVPAPVPPLNAQTPSAAREPSAPSLSPHAEWKLFGWTSGLLKVFREADQFAGRAEGPMTVELARGESESAQLVLLGGRRPTDVTVTVGPLRHVAREAVLPAESIRVSAVGYVKTRRPSYPVVRVGEWPDVLDASNAIRVPAGQLQPVWITVQAPEQALAGRYEGTVTVDDASGRRASMAFHVTVWDFALPRASHLRTAFDCYLQRLEQAYRDAVPGGQQWANRSQELLKRYHLAMLDSRLSPMWHADPTTPRFAWDVKTYLDAGLGMFAVGTRGGSFDNNWPRDPVGLEQAMVWYRQAELELRFLRLLDQAYVYVYDEPAPGDPHVAQVLARLRNEAPHLRRLLVMHEAPNPQQHAEWLKDADILCLRNAAWNAEWAAQYRAMGKELWLYVSSPAHPFPSLVIDASALAHRIIPWTAWKAGASGLLYWCVNFWDGDPRVNPASFQPDQNGNGFLFYPGADGPVPSLRLEMLRDGIEDYEYLARLRDVIEAAKTRAGVDASVIEHAQRLLAIDPSLVGSMRDYATDPGILLAQRRAIAAMIERLQQ